MRIRSAPWAAREIGMPRSTMWYLLTLGRVPDAFQIDGRWFLPQSTVEELRARYAEDGNDE